MELILNSVWLLVAIASMCLWLRLERRTATARHMPFVGLFLLIVILLPVISVDDDLWSIRNPADTKTFEYHEHYTTRLRAVFKPDKALPKCAVAVFQRLGTSLRAPLLSLDNPALDPIQNRPPPLA